MVPSESDDSDDGQEPQEPGEANAATHSVAMETSTAAELFPLLKLPRELRNRIYGCVFPQGRCAIVSRRFMLTLDGSSIPKNDGNALLRTSRQIYHEAFPFCYRNTKFVAWGNGLRGFLDTIGPTARINITNMSFRWSIIYPRPETFNLLTKCTRLSNLEIEVYDDSGFFLADFSQTPSVTLSALAQDHLNLPWIYGMRQLTLLKGLKVVKVTVDGYSMAPSASGFGEWLQKEITKPRK